MSEAKGVMYQAFEWNQPDDGSAYRDLASRAERLHQQGFTAVWFPPPGKGQAGPADVGYGVYDPYDLGEFDQKGAVRTKYGTKDELLAAIESVQQHGMDAYLDIVMGHRIGGDETEEVHVVEVDPAYRLAAVGDPYAIKAWSRYTYPGRAGAHSDFTWTHEHFNAFGADANQPDSGGKIFRRADREFSAEVDGEFGNFEYLMGANVDHSREDVRDELVRWGVWLLQTTKARGVRLDAVKHISRSFMTHWLGAVRGAQEGREVFAVGEYWTGSLETLDAYLQDTQGAMRLFDVPLHFRMHQAGESGRDFDLRTLLDETLVSRSPLAAVTFVDNHDSQPGQSLASPVADWFKPIAYAFILLRREGYPCVFHGDYVGNDGAQKLVSHQTVIDAMLAARAQYVYGDQHDYFERPTCVGWLTTGDAEHPGVMAVVASTADDDAIPMNVGRGGVVFRDVTQAFDHELQSAEDGTLEFPARGGRVSVWCSV